MAKDTDSDTPRKKRKGGSVLVWVILALVITGLGGFGVTNFGGGTTAIGRVGDREITAQDYARALRQEIDAMSAQFGMQMTMAQAQAFGIDRRVMQTLVTRAALDAEADRIGISVGDETVANEITQMPAFQGTAGRFDRSTYDFVLERNSLTPAEFEATLRDDVSRQILQGAVVGGFTAPAAMTDTLAAWAGERRRFSLLRLTEADLATPVADPTEADLTAFYDANIERFTKPEAKRITYIALVPEEIAPDQPVDEAALRAIYDERIDEFVVPEKRLVERLVFPDDNTAATAKGRLDAGESFETLVSERGLDLDDIDLGDVDKAALGAAGDAVFALTEPGVVGPLPSDLGPALFRMNGILAAQETSFDAAKESLAAEMQTDAARRAIADRVEEVDDLLAGGASLEEAANESGMTLATIDYVPGTEAGAEGIAAHPDFREAADAIAEGDFPEAILLQDGTLVALRLDEIVPPAPIPFAEAREAVDAAWRADALDKALAARAAEVKAAVDGGAALGGFGIVDVTPAITRDGFVEGAPQDFLTRVFDMQEGAVEVVEGDGFTGVVQLNAITPAEMEGEDAAALRDAIAIQAEQAIAQDAFGLFTTALSTEAGITLDQAAINAVHAQFN